MLTSCTEFPGLQVEHMEIIPYDVEVIADVWELESHLVPSPHSELPDPREIETMVMPSETSGRTTMPLPNDPETPTSMIMSSSGSD